MLAMYVFLKLVNRGCFFFQAEDGIRDTSVTGVQTCALPILTASGGEGPGGGRKPPQQLGEVPPPPRWPSGTPSPLGRSEERREGKECRTGWTADDKKKKMKIVKEAMWNELWQDNVSSRITET